LAFDEKGVKPTIIAKHKGEGNAIQILELAWLMLLSLFIHEVIYMRKRK